MLLFTSVSCVVGLFSPSMSIGNCVAVVVDVADEDEEVEGAVSSFFCSLCYTKKRK